MASPRREDCLLSLTAALDRAADAALRETQAAFNHAATYCASVAWEQGVTNKNKLHHIVYGATRATYRLGAQLACCARDKAAEAVRRARQDKNADCPTFRDDSSIRYDARTYRLMSLDRVSLNTVTGRRLVMKAKHDRKALALENLRGIRKPTAVRRSERRQRASWAFQQLRLFVCYKAQREGVGVVLIDLRNTSRTCSACGHCKKDNRKTQDRFVCVACGFAANTDVNAVVNISRAAVNQPIVSAPHVGAGHKLPAFAGSC